MPTYTIFFTNETGLQQIGEKVQISAVDTGDAINRFFEKCDHSTAQHIQVSSGIFSSSEIHPNPYFPKVSPVSKPENRNSVGERSSNRDSIVDRQTEILTEIAKTQKKQLYWIRIIGIPFLLAAIGSFSTLIIRAFN